MVDLESAMADGNISAIEADVLHGTDALEGSPTTVIMAHPPNRTSDLSFKRFLSTVVQDGKLQKHIKLDFKELAVVNECLEVVCRSQFDQNDRAIYLNADIVAGPGKRPEDVTVAADLFLQRCCAAMASTDKLFYFSLGFAVDVCSVFGHNKSHLAELCNVIKKYQLESSSIVLAVNTRLVAKNMAPFVDFLDRFPGSQLLLWVGSGEPPISVEKQKSIECFFQSNDHGNRVGFDVQVRFLSLRTPFTEA